MPSEEKKHRIAGTTYRDNTMPTPCTMPSFVNYSYSKLLPKGFWVLVLVSLHYGENYRKITSGFSNGFSCQLGPRREIEKILDLNEVL